MKYSEEARKLAALLLLMSQPLAACGQPPMASRPVHRADRIPATAGGHSFQRLSHQQLSGPGYSPGEVFVQEVPTSPVPPIPGHPGVHLNRQPLHLSPVPGMMAPQTMSPTAVGIPGVEPGLVHSPAPQQSMSSAAERRWSFNFQQAPWMTVLRTFAREAGMSFQAAVEPQGEFTYFDENLYTASETIDIFNDYLMISGQILVRDGNRIALTNATAEIPGNLIPFIPIHMIDSLGRNELASVAIPLRNADPNQAVEEIRQLQSPLGQVKALTNSGRVIVTDTGSYLKRMRDLLLGSGVAAGDGQAYVYQLKHAQAEDVARAISEFLSQNGSSAGGQTADGAVSALSSAPSGSQRVVAEKTTNSLLVRGSSEEMATIQRIIEELDRAPREVLVQALLVEVELGNTNEFGVELGFQDSVLFDRSVVDKIVSVTQTTTAPNGVQTTNQNVISQTAAPGFNFNNQPLGNNIRANPTHIAPQGLANLGVGRTNGDLGFGGLVLSAGSESVNILLRALDAHFNIDVLSRPQVRAVENHEAFIQIGQQVPVVDGVAVTPVGSANPVIRQDQAGIILKVTPRISPDGRVQLDVNAEKSAFNLAPGTGVPIFTDATNGNVIEAPIKDITTADTTVSIQSGQTIVLGGMITNDQAVVARKVPWLGDLPLIGRLFRYDLNKHKRKELLVFLTPVVLDGDLQNEQIKSRETGLIHMPAEAFSFGDNLHGIYGFGMDPQFIPSDNLQVTPSGAEIPPGVGLPASAADSQRQSQPSGTIRQASYSTESPVSRPSSRYSGPGLQARPTVGGFSAPPAGSPAVSDSIRQAPLLVEPPGRKTKSFWERPVSFPGFRKRTAASGTPQSR